MIILQSDGYTAWILPGRGASCVRLSKDGAEALRTPETLDNYSSQPFFYGTPLLFPPNRISGGAFSFDGRVYRLPVNEPKTGCFLHGTLHESAFSVVSQQETEAVLQYRATTEKPYLTWPDPFTITVRWSLSAEGLRQETRITNDAALRMPTALAFHTTFNLPFAQGSAPENVRMQLDTSAEYSRNMQNYLPDGGVTADYPDREDMLQGRFSITGKNISRFFEMGDRHELVLRDEKAGLQVRYHAGDSFGYWMVVNGGHADFICVEPQSWLSNCPNAPFDRAQTGFDALAPGETRTYETMLSIESL